MIRKIQILLISEQKLFSAGLRNLLNLESDMEVIGEAINSEEAIDIFSKSIPDIIILDSNIQEEQFMLIHEQLKIIESNIKCIFLIENERSKYLQKENIPEIFGVLSKTMTPEELFNKLRLVYSGKKIVDKKLLNMVSEVKLTLRETDVLKLIAEGMVNKEIAEKLYISEKTVKNHVSNILRKLNVFDRTQAAIYAIRNKF